MWHALPVLAPTSRYFSPPKSDELVFAPSQTYNIVAPRDNSPKLKFQRPPAAPGRAARTSDSEVLRLGVVSKHSIDDIKLEGDSPRHMQQTRGAVPNESCSVTGSRTTDENKDIRAALEARVASLEASEQASSRRVKDLEELVSASARMLVYMDPAPKRVPMHLIYHSLLCSHFQDHRTPCICFLRLSLFSYTRALLLTYLVSCSLKTWRIFCRERISASPEVLLARVIQHM